MKTFLAATLIALMMSCNSSYTKLDEYDDTREFYYLPADSQMVAREFYFDCLDSLGGSTPINDSKCFMLMMDKYGQPFKSDGERIEF